MGRGRAPNHGRPTPRQGAPPPPRAPSCRPHSTQSQHARARAVELVMGPHAHTPGTHSQWVVGSGRTPQGRVVRRQRAPNPGRPTAKQEAPSHPPGALVPPPKRAKSARKSARCGVGDGSPRPHPPHPQPVRSGPRQHAPGTGGRAWESAQPRTPHTQARDAPPPGCPRAAPTARKASSQGQACLQGGERPQARQGDETTRPAPQS